jgi:hypothetical protein
MIANGIRKTIYKGRERRVGKKESIKRTITGKGSRYRNEGSILYRRAAPATVRTNRKRMKTISGMRWSICGEIALMRIKMRNKERIIHNVWPIINRMMLPEKPIFVLYSARNEFSICSE